MSEPFIGEIRMIGFNFAPVGWANCDGRLMPISENDTLFALIGTTYGGDGQETFALPDLRGRVPIHVGPQIGSGLGASGGSENVTLTVQQIPSHSHPLLAADAIGGAKSPANNFLARPTTINMYSGDSPDTQLGTAAIMPTGGSQPHENMQPFLCINFVISLFGIFPQQT
jgi:microcystin-dependent protein